MIIFAIKSNKSREITVYVE